MKSVLFVLLTILLFSMVTTPAEAEQGWRLVSVQELDQFGFRTATRAIVSPDASQLAIWDFLEDMCVYAFETADAFCVESESIEGIPGTMVWSPDGQYVALHEDAFRANYESDIWIFSVAERTFTNLTDDQADGDLFDARQGEEPFWLDFSPCWTADSLYFTRMDLEAEQVGLYRLPLDTATFAGNGQPELVVNLTPYVADYRVVYTPSAYDLSGFLDISPDGTQAVMIAFSEDFTSFEESKLLLIDLVNGDVSELVTGAALLPVG